MIEKIKYNNKLFALIVRGKYRNKKGISFFTEDKDIQQFGYMNHKKIILLNLIYIKDKLENYYTLRK